MDDARFKTAQSLQLPDWWIGAGFVRNKVWDTLSGFTERTKNTEIDIDVVYFDPANIVEEQEKLYDQKLLKLMPNENWSVKNQARMHIPYGEPPFVSSGDAISKWPETATAIAVTITTNGELELFAPYGLEDITAMNIRMTPNMKLKQDVFFKRLQKKQWQSKWPKITIIMPEN